MLKRNLPNLIFYIAFVLAYFFISIRVTHRFYMLFSLLLYILIAGFIIYEGIRIVKKKHKSMSVKIIDGVVIILLSAAILYSKIFIDNRNFVVLRSADQNISVYKIVNNSIESNKKIDKYNSSFKISNYANNTIYYTDEFKPALKLVYAYLGKAKQDNAKLFGNIPAGKFTVKFDYDEEVFDERDPIVSDYAGLYFDKDETAYIYIKDCYSQALAYNLGSLFLQRALFHEYTHHVFYKFMDLNQIPKSKIPVWFMEGVAEYIGYEGDSGPSPSNMVAFSQLNTQEQWKSYCNDGYDVYQQSHYAVRQLMLMRDEKVIRDILLKAKDEDFNTAFKEVVVISLKDYEKALNDDFKNGWKKFYKMVPSFTPVYYTDIKTQCLEEYTRLNPDNIDALLDLALSYENSNDTDKERIVLNTAVEKDPKNTMTWHRLALFHERMNDFDSAIKEFEKVISIDKSSAAGYSNLAQAWLTKDVDKAAAAIQKAKKLDKSSFIRKQAEVILNYQSCIRNNKPYEGCLQLIRSDIIYDENIKKAIIEKLLKEYPSTRNSARGELEKIKNKLR